MIEGFRSVGVGMLVGYAQPVTAWATGNAVLTIPWPVLRESVKVGNYHCTSPQLQVVVACPHMGQQSNRGMKAIVAYYLCAGKGWQSCGPTLGRKGKGGSGSPGPFPPASEKR